VPIASQKKTGEGLVLVSSNPDQAVIAEINCDTDFVARTADFRLFAQGVVESAAQQESTDTFTHLDTSSILASPFGSETLASRRKELEKVLGESVIVARALKIFPDKSFGEVVGAYQHGEYGKFAGVVLLRPLAVTSSREELQKLANKLAVHVVGFSPKSIEAAEDANKETALVEQEFAVWEDHPADQTLLVKDVLTKVGASVVQFVRWTRGEQV